MNCVSIYYLNISRLLGCKVLGVENDKSHGYLGILNEIEILYAVKYVTFSFSVLNISKIEFLFLEKVNKLFAENQKHTTDPCPVI